MEIKLMVITMNIHLLYQLFFNRLIFLISMMIRPFAPIKKGRILMWSYGGKTYSCNPRAMTEYIVKNCPYDYEVYWAFLPGKKSNSLPSNVKSVVMKTLKYIWVVNTAEFLVTNTRNYLSNTLWIKKKGQKYIMTWHSSMGVKCIEADASVESLSQAYVKAAKFDSKQCDLILSGSRARSEIIKRAFWYGGEILEKGTPRNDLLFDSKAKLSLQESVRKHFNIPLDAKIVLYAPTFRKSGELTLYKLKWNRIRDAFCEMMGTNNCYCLLRLHPNLIDTALDTSNLAAYSNVIDATYYPEMQELLVAADILITDYSSSIFDFAYIKKPVFIYAPDFKVYDRNTYFDLDKLPFGFSQSETELVNVLRTFDESKYLADLNAFLKDRIGSYETGKANDAVVKWMKSKSI